jgi:predicted transcriptional regulator
MCVLKLKNGRRIMKKLDTKSINKILSAIASGEKLANVATRFDVSEITVGNIARGATHASITGLAGEKSGVKYIQANKEKFVIAKSTRAKVETPAEPIESVGGDTESVETPIAVATTRVPRKPRAKKAVTVSTTTIEDRAKALKDQAVQIVADLDSSISAMGIAIAQKESEINGIRAKQNDMELSRAHWKSVLSAMTPEA